MNMNFPVIKILEVEKISGTKSRRQKNACIRRCGKVIAQQKNLKRMVESTFGLNDKLTVSWIVQFIHD